MSAEVIQPRVAGGVTVVVLTFNEALNLRACLASVAGWARAIYVVDSGSTDATLEIASGFGARVLRHPFETHARQWVWALDALDADTDWVLGIDADQRLTPALRDDISGNLARAGIEIGGFYVCRRQIFRGRWIRHGGYYPKYLLKVFRRSRVRLEPDELVDHHFYVDGVTRNLRGDLIEDNRNEAEIFVWTAKHNRYAQLQAAHELKARARAEAIAWSDAWKSPDARTSFLKSLWQRLPLFVRPCLYVFYRYVCRLGFLDGRQGFIFHVLQGFWYRLLVDINIEERRSAATGREGETAQ